MTSVDFVILEVPDTTAADAFYATAFDLGDRVRTHVSETASTGFRGFTLSLVVSQPATVDLLIGSAVDAGAASLKAPRKSLWGYGGVVRAPDGAIWKVATSAKKSSGPATRHVDDVVVLLGADDVAASKRFYLEHGLAVDKSFGRKYVQFASQPAEIKLALYGRRALAKDAGVAAAGSGSHRIALGGSAGSFTDPDGFAWETASPGKPREMDAAHTRSGDGG